jgi:hypothetical protein
LPITRCSFGAVIVDCAVPSGAPTPVRLPAWDDPDDTERTRVLVASLGELVRWWLQAIDSGGWCIEAATGSWVRDEDRIPPQRALTGLV